MEPYYSHGGITIYHGDALDVVSDLEFDCIVSDPPYGIAYKASGGKKWNLVNVGEAVVGDDAPFDPATWLEHGVPTILWGGNHYADKLPASQAWFCWDKRVDPKYYGKMSFADCELAWTNLGGPARMYSQLWNGIIRAGEESAGRSVRLHPTQKPVRLMRWCLGKTEGVVLDPYMGSGTTLRAAMDLGRPAIGIEIVEKYCEVAANRLRQQSIFGIADVQAQE